MPIQVQSQNQKIKSHNQTIFQYTNQHYDKIMFDKLNSNHNLSISNRNNLKRLYSYIFKHDNYEIISLK